ncbi:MAG: type 1 glutamine amidotransferase [Phormidesmis sp.]
MNILVVQNSSLDPIGIFGEHLIQQGAQLTTWLTEDQPAPPIGDYSGLIVLGGPMNAHEGQKFLHLRQTVDLIRKFHREEKPILGICLGAQLIARAFGSTVYPHRVPELGFSPIYATRAAAQDPCVGDFADGLSIMQWHFDTFELPVGATRLLTNQVCPNQAYRVSDNVYGFQFHFEVTPEIVMSWLSMKNEWIEANYPHLDEEIKAQAELYSQRSAQFAKTMAIRWLNLVPSAIAVPTSTDTHSSEIAA